MKNSLATHANVCATCSTVFRPRRDNPDARYCSKACHHKLGVRFRHDDKVGYFAWHNRVYKKFGKASDHACFALCCRPAKQWAQMGDVADVDSYVPMCVSCHKKADLAYLRSKTSKHS